MGYIEIKWRCDRHGGYQTLKGDSEKKLSKFFEIMVLKYNVNFKVNNHIPLPEKLIKALRKDFIEITWIEEKNQWDIKLI